MAFKTIVVHVAEDETSHARCEAAADLAESWDARVIGVALAATPAPFVADGAIGMTSVWAEATANAEDKARAAAEAFSAQMSKRGVQAEVRVASGFEEMAAETFAISARYADISVLGGRDGVESRGLADALIERALFDTGRPTLMVPAKGWPRPIGGSVALAWDGGSQAARAATDALPFLTRARSVHVLLADPESGSMRHGDEPGADVAGWLSRHGVKVQVNRFETGDLSTADAITAAAQAAGADLLVMGGYGHSRLRESIFGGVTTSMIDSPALPTLMSR